MLAMFGHLSHAQDDLPEDYDGDDGGGYGDGDDDYDGGGYGDGDGDGDGPTEVQHLKTAEDFDKFLDNADASVIGAFSAEKMFDPTSVRPADWDEEEDGEFEPATIDNPDLAAFKTTGTGWSSEHGFRFAYTSSPELLEKMKVKKEGVYLFRSPWYLSTEDGDRPRETFPGNTPTEAGIAHWALSKAQPLVGEFTMQTMGRYKNVLIIFVEELKRPWSNMVKYVLKRARKVAVGIKDKLAVAVASKETLEELGESMNSHVLMEIRHGTDSDAPRYRPSAAKPFSADSLQEFANAYLAGELKPYEDPSGDEAEAADKKGEDL
jgi:hypothetical protein